MNNLTLRPLQKYDFRMVYYNDKWEILPATYEVEQIVNLMSKDGTYEKCLKILSDEAANVYIQDLPTFVALNKKYAGYKFYPLYVQDIASLYEVEQ